MAGFADQHFLGFAAREIENVGGHEIVEQDHVGRLQRAHGPQRQQFRIAGTGADQNDRAGLVRRKRRQQRVEIGIGRRPVRRGERARGEFFPKTAATAERQRQRLHARPPSSRGFGPAGKTVRDQGFDLGADRLAEHRRGAVGGNADDQRRTIDDGAEGEIAKRRTVDDIHRHAGARAAAANSAASLSSAQSATAMAAPTKSAAAQAR